MGTVTRTVVFTDLANYTAKVSRGGREDLLRILEEHEALVTPIIEKYGGRVVKNLGDSFMCLFNAATPALRAALDIQALVVGEGSNPIRLAMTTGDMEDIEGDAFGEAVNLSARILSKTPAGEVWFGAGTGLCIYSAEIPWESVGRFRLKGIPGERELFRAVPAHRCWLPDPVLQAARRGTLVHLEQGQRPPLLPPDPVVLLKGFVPGSKELGSAVDLLPVVDPACLWLSTYNIAAEDRIRWTEEGRGLVVGTPEALEEAIQDASKVVTRPMGSDTIILDLGADVDIELVMCGLALPAVPFSEVVSSYSYDLLADGRWANQSDRAVLRVEVGASGTSLRGLSPGVTVNGRSVGSEDRVELEDGAQVRCSAGTLEFRRLDRGYAGMMLLDSDMRLGVTAGQVAELGREPNHPGMAFPDRRGQDNIRWCPGPRAARARAGGFTLDRALAGRRQAQVQLVGGTVQLTSLHRLPTYIYGVEGDMDLVEEATYLEVGDMVVSGTTVIGLREPE